MFNDTPLYIHYCPTIDKKFTTHVIIRKWISTLYTNRLKNVVEIQRHFFNLNSILLGDTVFWHSLLKSNNLAFGYSFPKYFYKLASYISIMYKRNYNEIKQSFKESFFLLIRVEKIGSKRHETDNKSMVIFNRKWRESKDRLDMNILPSKWDSRETREYVLSLSFFFLFFSLHLSNPK